MRIFSSRFFAVGFFFWCFVLMCLCMTRFHHGIYESPPLLPCATGKQRRALFIVCYYSVSVFA